MQRLEVSGAVRPIYESLGVKRLTAPYYRKFLENELPLSSEDVPHATRGRMLLQHGESPLHCGRQWPEFLIEYYEGRGIVRNGPFAWPARSPDFNPSHFFLCRCMKSRVWQCGKQKVRRPK